jgi:molecular chaperone DnaJ
MIKQDYYELLGVPRNSDAEDVKKAYRRLALKCHPDRNKGDKALEEEFKLASEAYEVLSDPEKRQIYDQFGHDGLKQTGFTGSRNFNDIFSSFGDIFGDFFGFGPGGPSQNHRRRGADLRYNLSIDFMDAVFGKDIEIEVPQHVSCHQCNGIGTNGGIQPSVCPACGGRGQVIRSQGPLTISTPCPSCQGSGRVITDPCRTCNGSGRVVSHKKLSIKIPSGVEDGSRLRLQGEGEPGSSNAPHGDLYVFINVKPHEIFQRNGNDVVVKVPIKYSLAVLGGDVEIPTLKGTDTISIPKGSQPGQEIHLPGKGVPFLRGKGCGNLVAVVEITVPKTLSKEEEEILRNLAKIEGNKYV